MSAAGAADTGPPPSAAMPPHLSFRRSVRARAICDGFSVSDCCCWPRCWPARARRGHKDWSAERGGIAILHADGQEQRRHRDPPVLHPRRVGEGGRHRDRAGRPGLGGLGHRRARRAHALPLVRDLRIPEGDDFGEAGHEQASRRADGDAPDLSAGGRASRCTA